MLRRRRNKDDGEDSNRWLLTYADLITLLLAFFVVMYSMSQIDAKKFGQMAKAFNGILKGGELDLTLKPSVLPSDNGHGLLKIGDLQMLQKFLEDTLKREGMTEETVTEVTERGLVIHIVESALFSEAAADLQSRAMSILDLVALKIKDRSNHIRIEGHTDDRPISNERFPSNWELSAARATEVVRFFIDRHQIEPGRISALGYGAYRPIRLNNSIENRARNRRVDIVVLTTELSMKEPSSQLYELAQQP